MKEIKNKKILIVDDEKEILKILSNILFNEGFFNIYTASDCKEALEIVKREPIALFILDVALPDGNGFALFEEIRRFSKAPVIFLTAKGEADDKIRGLGLGADDYIVKPFIAKELILRTVAILKRTYIKNEEISSFRLSDRIVSLESAVIKYNGSEMPLTAKEFIIIKKLWENKNRIVTNDALCMAAWGDKYYGYENTLMVHIRRIRKKIEDEPSKPKHLITIKGIGYKLVIKDE